MKEKINIKREASDFSDKSYCCWKRQTLFYSSTTDECHPLHQGDHHLPKGSLQEKKDFLRKGSLLFQVPLPLAVPPLLENHHPGRSLLRRRRAKRSRPLLPVFHLEKFLPRKELLVLQEESLSQLP
jgi:hypothetical protein